MPYKFKSRSELTDDERNVLSGYVNRIANYFDSGSHEDSLGHYSITNKEFTIVIDVADRYGLEHSYAMGFKLGDDGNIFQVPEEELMNNPLHVSPYLHNKIVDTLKNLIVQSQDGGKRRKYKSRKSTRRIQRRRTIRTRRY